MGKRKKWNAGIRRILALAMAVILVSGTLDLTTLAVGKDAVTVVGGGDCGADGNEKEATVTGSIAGVTYPTIVYQAATITASDITDKTYGGVDFSLGVTDTNPEADVQYTVTASTNAAGETVSNDAVITVDKNGIAKIKGAGSATVSIFLPASANYSAAEKTITVTVEKAAYAPNMPGTAISASAGCETVNDVGLPTGWVWQAACKDMPLTAGEDAIEAVPAKAEYTGADK